MNYSDRVVLVTGAANGIGRALCRLMGRGGARLGLVDRDAAGLEALAGELRAGGVRCAAAAADVADRPRTRDAAAAVEAALGPVDVLVAAAGVCGVSHVDDLRVEEAERILRVNFLGVVYAIDAVLPGMLRRGRGQVVGVSSLAAFRGIPCESAYGASKAALTSYLESLRPPLRRRGVEVTTVFPGYVRTALLDGVLADSGARPPRRVLSAEAAAARIAAAVRRGDARAAFPRPLCWLVRGGCYLPAVLYDWFMTHLPAGIFLPHPAAPAAAPPRPASGSSPPA